ncbi:DUF3006 domain-containing protein [Thermoanaerobacter wiegelii]|uniref:DUF3006 domain-containing protein n=1 Tax=Thermoanaerobacter wiegelii Rt8.B1 TaxID=697303 RepID=G2MTV6_9THEO|nr:DUF3006 domain-containing protein [Thermoanaerobacter wiegelii]AEM79491.1 hypothetical protein Thewi_2140 [Thermoanaerobacter wiegelii Rt8.B1]
MPERTQKLCIIDRFEEGWVVIEYGEQFFNFPKELLPKEVKEGDILKFNVEIDIEETEKCKKAIEGLAKELFTDE